MTLMHITHGCLLNVVGHDFFRIDSHRFVEKKPKHAHLENRLEVNICINQPPHDTRASIGDGILIHHFHLRWCKHRLKSLQGIQKEITRKAGCAIQKGHIGCALGCQAFRVGRDFPKKM
jgi:uncharacterized membrane protein